MATAVPQAATKRKSTHVNWSVNGLRKAVLYMSVTVSFQDKSPSTLDLCPSTKLP
jgi:hypothetical protein